jgi:acetyltransferase-like isoleucine patch superfamily enzyme
MRHWIDRFRRRRALRGNADRIARLRHDGARIGNDCRIYSTSFSTEPYLVQLGDRVVVAAGVRFIPHNALAFRLRPQYPDLQVFAPIRVGDETTIATNAIILAGANIGRNCFINAGAVVQGTIPDDSIASGNPARVFGRVSDLLAELPNAPGRLDVYRLPPAERRDRIERYFGLK